LLAIAFDLARDKSAAGIYGVHEIMIEEDGTICGGESIKVRSDIKSTRTVAVTIHPSKLLKV
jgi:hypothetical protein